MDEALKYNKLFDTRVTLVNESTGGSAQYKLLMLVLDGFKIITFVCYRHSINIKNSIICVYKR